MPPIHHNTGMPTRPNKENRTLKLPLISAERIPTKTKKPTPIPRNHHQLKWIESVIILIRPAIIPANPNHIIMFLTTLLDPLKLLEETILNPDHVNRPMAIQNK